MMVLGVDVGTTGVKAVAFSEEGAIAGQAYEEYPLRFPFEGAAELDAAGVRDAALRVIAAAAAETERAGEVRAIGVASQGEAFAALDASGAPLCDLMVSSDTRGETHMETLAARFGPERLYAITGHTPHPMYSACKLLWLKERRPDVWKAATRFLFAADLVTEALTGEAFTDHSVAARTMLFDVRARDWSEALLGYVGLERSRLPRLLRAGTPGAPLRSGMADRLGLPAGVVVTTAGHDQPVGALGCGAAAPGAASYSIGTVECITPALAEPRLTEDLRAANLAVYPHVAGELYTSVAFNVTGGSALRWLRDALLPEVAEAARAAGEDPYDRITAMASPEPSELTLVPHFGPTGTPHFDVDGAGVLFGLDLSTSRAEVIRAFLEGITLEMRWNLEALRSAGFRLTELRAIGGGSKSRVWMQIKADILGVPLASMRVTEATCMGAALLAGQAAGAWDAAERSRAWATIDRVHEPSGATAAAYADRFALYQDVYRALGAARERLARMKGTKRNGC